MIVKVLSALLLHLVRLTGARPYALCLQVKVLAKHTEHDPEKIAKDLLRPKYFDPHAAVEYNLIDRVLESGELETRDKLREASKFA